MAERAGTEAGKQSATNLGGRPKKYGEEMRRVSLWLPDSLLRAIDEYTQNGDRSTFIRQAVAAALQRATPTADDRNAFLEKMRATEQRKTERGRITVYGAAPTGVGSPAAPKIHKPVPTIIATAREIIETPLFGRPATDQVKRDIAERLVSDKRTKPRRTKRPGQIYPPPRRPK